MGDGPAPHVTGRIEIMMLSNGQFAVNVEVPNRFLFNAMMETAKQNGLADFARMEQQKVVLPEIDPTRLKI